LSAKNFGLGQLCNLRNAENYAMASATPSRPRGDAAIDCWSYLQHAGFKRRNMPASRYISIS